MRQQSTMLMLLMLFASVMLQGQTLESGTYEFRNSSSSEYDEPRQCIIRSLKPLGIPEEVLIYYNGGLKKLIRMSTSGILSEFKLDHDILVSSMVVSPSEKLYICGKNVITNIGVICRIDIPQLLSGTTPLDMDIVGIKDVDQLVEIEAYPDPSSGMDAIVAIGKEYGNFDNRYLVCCTDDIFEPDGADPTQSQADYSLYKIQGTSVNLLKLAVTNSYISLICSYNYFDMGIYSEPLASFSQKFQNGVHPFGSRYRYTSSSSLDFMGSQVISAVHTSGDEVAVATMTTENVTHIAHTQVRTYDVSSGDMIEAQSITTGMKADPVSLLHVKVLDSLVLTQLFDLSGDSKWLNIPMACRDVNTGSYTVCATSTHKPIIATEVDDHHNFVCVKTNLINIKDMSWPPNVVNDTCMSMNISGPCYSYEPVVIYKIDTEPKMPVSTQVLQWRHSLKASYEQLPVYETTDYYVVPQCSTIFPGNLGNPTHSCV